MTTLKEARQAVYNKFDELIVAMQDVFEHQDKMEEIPPGPSLYTLENRLAAQGLDIEKLEGFLDKAGEAIYSLHTQLNDAFQAFQILDKRITSLEEEADECDCDEDAQEEECLYQITCADVMGQRISSDLLDAGITDVAWGATEDNQLEIFLASEDVRLEANRVIGAALSDASTRGILKQGMVVVVKVDPELAGAKDVPSNVIPIMAHT